MHTLHKKSRGNSSADSIFSFLGKADASLFTFSEIFFLCGLSGGLCPNLKFWDALHGVENLCARLHFFHLHALGTHSSMLTTRLC